METIKKKNETLIESLDNSRVILLGKKTKKSLVQRIATWHVISGNYILGLTFRQSFVRVHFDTLA